MLTFAQKQPVTQRTSSAKSTILSRRLSGQNSDVQSILGLQRTVGNQTVQRLLRSNAGELQMKSAITGSTGFGPVQAQEDRGGTGNGIPYPLKSGLESLSNIDLSGIRVHKNSAKPAQINALAYTQGQDIYMGPGQEKHLPHEGWHAVQQMQGRVKPTTQAKGVLINDDAGLEREADTMGAKALDMKGAEQTVTNSSCCVSMSLQRVMQRTLGDGHDLSAPWLAGDIVLEAIYDDERLMQNGSRGTAVKKVQQLLFYLGIDFPAHGADGIFGPETKAAVEEFQRSNVDEAGVQLVVDGIVGPLTMGALNREANRTGTHIGNLTRTAPIPALQGPPTATPVPLSVDRIDIVDSAAGAIGGYPAIVGNADLNNPGPFNDAATGETRNTHQIHFHLDNGNSASLSPRRELQRSAFRAGHENKNPADQPLPPGVAGPPTPGGFTGVLVGPDGPPPHEIQRPTADTIVIADSPGSLRTLPAEYPYIYRSHFTLTVEDARSAPIARIKYDVRIERRNAGDIPNTENQIVATEKRDFVRGRNL